MPGPEIVRSSCRGRFCDEAALLESVLFSGAPYNSCTASCRRAPLLQRSLSVSLSQRSVAVEGRRQLAQPFRAIFCGGRESSLLKNNAVQKGGLFFHMRLCLSLSLSLPLPLSLSIYIYTPCPHFSLHQVPRLRLSQPAAVRDIASQANPCGVSRACLQTSGQYSPCIRLGRYSALEDWDSTALQAREVQKMLYCPMFLGPEEQIRCAVPICWDTQCF